MNILVLVCAIALSQEPGRSGSTEAEDAEGWRKYDLVKVTVNADQVKGCRSLGLMKPGNWVPKDPLSRRHDLARMEVRWAAAQMGANAFLVTPSGAEGYRCAAAKKNPAKKPTARPGTARTERRSTGGAR